MIRKMNFLVLTAVFALCAVSGAAQYDKKKKPKKELTGVKADVVRQLDEANKKLVALAEAMPEDKFKWRPGKGVRAVSQVFMHVAGTNYLIPTFVGVKAEGFEGRQAFDRLTALEGIHKKSDVVAELKKSFKHARMAVMKVSDADLDKEVDFFGNKSTVRGVLVLMAVHCHEHLGQAIAYARINNVVPPWSVRPDGGE